MSKVTLEKLRKRIVKLEEDNKELNENLDLLLKCLSNEGILTVEEKEEETFKKDLEILEEPKNFVLKEINKADKNKLVEIITIIQESCVENNFSIDVKDFYANIFHKRLNDFKDLNELEVEELRKFASRSAKDLPVINSIIKTLSKIF